MNLGYLTRTDNSQVNRIETLDKNISFQKLTAITTTPKLKIF